MNKILNFFILFIFLNNCSFDNKTGIWTGSEQVEKKNDETDSNLEFIFKKENNIVKEKDLSSGQNIQFTKPVTFSAWTQSYQNKSNNIGNVSFLNEGKYKKLSRISKTNINKNILVHKNNLFFSDFKGNIGIFSLNENRLVFKYNFYKKKIKNQKKNIKLIIKNDVLIAADNFGYVYSIDYKKNKILWAKNYLVPFRSNLKIINQILFISDEKNKIILIDIKNGNLIDELYTQPSKTVSKFESNIAIDNNNNILFLSTSGSLYSMNLINQKKINWIHNFKTENEIIFDANPITVSEDEIIISTNKNISFLNTKGLKRWDLKINSNIKPIISGNIILTVNKENYLILIDKNSGKIIYSKNINLLIKKDYKKNFQKKLKQLNDIFLIDNKLLLISNNSFFIEIEIDNMIKVNSIKNNPFKISSNIVFLKDEMIFVSNSKRIYKVN